MTLAEKAKKLLEAEKRPNAVDPEAEKTWWLEQLEEIYRQVEQWLAPLVENGLVVKIERTKVRVTEEHLGQYLADALVLGFGSDEVILLHPKGTFIIGARGRVDVYRTGNASRIVMLILGTDKANPRWTIWPSRNDRKPWTKDNFEAVLEALLPAAP